MTVWHFKKETSSSKRRPSPTLGYLMRMRFHIHRWFTSGLVFPIRSSKTWHAPPFTHSPYSLIAGAAHAHVGSAAVVSESSFSSVNRCRYTWHALVSRAAATWAVHTCAPAPPPPAPPQPATTKVTYNATTKVVSQPLDQVSAQLTADLATDNRILSHLAAAIKIATVIKSREALEPYPFLSGFWRKNPISRYLSSIEMGVRYASHLKTAFALQEHIKNERASTLAQLNALAVVSQWRYL